jgi:hypothetical protein
MNAPFYNGGPPGYGTPAPTTNSITKSPWPIRIYVALSVIIVIFIIVSGIFIHKFNKADASSKACLAANPGTDLTKKTFTSRRF